jgi:hypothetical protein
MFHATDGLVGDQEQLPNHGGGILDESESLGGVRSESRCGERGFNRIRHAQVLPMRSRKPIEAISHSQSTVRQVAAFA